MQFLSLSCNSAAYGEFITGQTKTGVGPSSSHVGEYFMWNIEKTVTRGPAPEQPHPNCCLTLSFHISVLRICTLKRNVPVLTRWQCTNTMPIEYLIALCNSARLRRTAVRAQKELNDLFKVIWWINSTTQILIWIFDYKTRILFTNKLCVILCKHSILPIYC